MTISVLYIVQFHAGKNSAMETLLWNFDKAGIIKTGEAEIFAMGNL